MSFLYRPFDPRESRNVVLYTRMSSDQQNKRSPEQQEEMVSEVLRRMGYPWTIIKQYSDKAKSGRRMRNRPDYNRMLNDLKANLIPAKFILVDTIERFGRVEGLDSIRRDLYQRNGIVILSADRFFDDPNSPQGQATTVLESFRAAEDSRIKRHNVIRGKRDAILQRYWPGGPVPFGLKLNVVATETRGRREVRHHSLIHHEVNAAIVRSAFMKSLRNPSMGQELLTRWLNDRPDIPDQLKPFHPDTVGRWLKNAIYHGELIWSEFTTGLIDDIRVLQRNPDDEVLRVPDFCEPIIEKWQFDEIAAFRQRRRTNDNTTNGDQRNGIGMVYAYMLTGLVRCGHCNSSMVPNGTGTYTTKSGQERRYTAFMCPKSRSGICHSKVRVNEEWLREVVIGKLRERVLPNDAGTEPSWLPEITQLVQQELDRQREEEDISRPALEAEIEQLERQTTGWSSSLAKPDLSQRLREKIESDYSDTLDRIAEIEVLLHRQAAEELLASEIVDSKSIVSSLDSLSSILADDDPSMANLMLSMHIDRIDVFDTGRIEMRMCKLGSCPESIEWFGGQSAESSDAAMANAAKKTKARRRTRICTDLMDCETPRLGVLAELASDPDRFHGMPDSWFWVDEFSIPEKSCWSKDNAQAVLARYQKIQMETGKKPSCNALAKEFGVSRPTILKALDEANSNGSETPTAHRRQPTVKVKGNAGIEARIEALHKQGVLEKDIAADIGVSRSTITLALNRLYEKRGIEKPDGRRERHRR